MTRIKTSVAVALALVTVCAYSLHADVRTDEKTKVELGGVLGRMVNIFGGKSAREGVTSSVAVKGDRLARTTDTTGQIIDLSEEKVYDLDIRKKSYTVTTFAELRRRMEEAQRKAEEAARKESSKESSKETAKKDPNQKEMEIDFDLKETGQKKTINGFDTREVVMTITMREKGKTLEQGGGMVMTNDLWLAPKVASAGEIAAFYQRYAQKLAGPTIAGASAQDMAAALAMYPMMKQALARMSTENVKMDGTSILSTMTMDAVKSADEAAQDAKRGGDEDKGASSGSIGGLLGGLTRKAAPKKDANENPARTTFMTTTSELLRVTPTVSAADVAIPAGFRENK